MHNNFNQWSTKQVHTWFYMHVLIVLADRFGGGYVVTMKIKAAKAGLTPDLVPAESFMDSSFPGCIQREKHYNTLQYEIAAASLARVFQLVLTNKERLNIEDYSVSQTTLDQVRCDKASSSKSFFMSILTSCRQHVKSYFKISLWLRTRKMAWFCKTGMLWFRDLLLGMNYWLKFPCRDWIRFAQQMWQN